MLIDYIRRHLPPLPVPRRTEIELPRSRQGRLLSLILLLLRSVPPILVALFVFSFWWDVPIGDRTYFGVTYRFEHLLRIIAVSGLIGYLTNWLAITMLFHPRQRRPLLGQGLIPAQRERVILRLAKTVSEELINEEIIKEKIEESGLLRKYRDMVFAATRNLVEDTEFRNELKTFLARYVNETLSSPEVRDRIVTFMEDKIHLLAGRGVAGLALRSWRFWNEDDFRQRLDEAVQEIPASMDTLLDELDSVIDQLPDKIEARASDIENWSARIVLGFVERLDIYGIVVSNMQKYSEDKLEAVIRNASNEQLRYIKYLGGVLGVFGGLVIWEPFTSLILFVTGGSALYALDSLLMMRFRTRRRADSPPDPAGRDGAPRNLPA